MLVCFITKLSRMENSANFVGFQGGEPALAATPCPPRHGAGLDLSRVSLLRRLPLHFCL